MAILDDVKQACGVIDSEYDSYLNDLIGASIIDLGIAGVNGEYVVETNTIVKQAIKTYCKMNFSIFGLPENYEDLKKSYDEQKAQLSMASGYTTWGSE